MLNNSSILLIIDSMGIGGAEKVTLTLAQGFINQGYSVDLIICDNIIGFDIPKEINLHILDFQKGLLDYYRYSKKLHLLVESLEKDNNAKFDLILVHLQKAVRLMKNFKHKNIYFTIHSNFTQSSLKGKRGLQLYFRKRKLQKIYNGLNIITVSKGIEKDLLTSIGVRPKSIQTIYNPVDIEYIQKLAKEPNILNNEKDYIIHVGRFSKVKRHDILLRSFKKANLNVKLVLVGDGEEKDNIVHLISELGLAHRVILTGFLQNPYPLIQDAKILVLSSEYEGFGNVIVESIVLKTVAISTNCKSGPNEILTGDFQQFLTPVNDIETLSSMMKFVEKDTHDLNFNMIKKFSLDTIINKYLGLIYV